MSGLNALFAPTGCVERNIDNDPIPGEGLAMDCRAIEIVQASTSAPYGTLEVEMADGQIVELTRLETGWEHIGQFVRLVSSSGINIARFWR